MGHYYIVVIIVPSSPTNFECPVYCVKFKCGDWCYSYSTSHKL